LQDCPRLGRAGLSAIVERFLGDVPDSVYGRPREWYIQELGLNPRAATALASYAPTPKAGIERLPVRLLTRFDPDYPVALRANKDRPPILSVHGGFAMELTNGSLAVMCSRGWELEHTEEVKSAIETAIQAGYRLVAGHNRPVYQWALLAAKRNRTDGVMVLDRGLLSAFDPDMRRDPVIAARIWGYGFDEERCLAISPFRLSDGWKACHGPLRDDLIATLADTIIVMGVREGGVMEGVCSRALACNKTVLAGPDAGTLLSHDGVATWRESLPAPVQAQGAADAWC
jgi:predicted Rossmann fold nucleotide-binding protein DprA/Smf involved in DNA uptake